MASMECLHHVRDASTLHCFLLIRRNGDVGVRPGDGKSLARLGEVKLISDGGHRGGGEPSPGDWTSISVR